MIRPSHFNAYKDFCAACSHQVAAWRGTLRVLWDIQVKVKDRNKLLLGRNVAIIFQDSRSALVLEDSGLSSPVREVFTPNYPHAAAVGIGPGWKFIDPPTTAPTTIDIGPGSILRLYQNTRICPGVYITCGKGAEVVLGANSRLGHNTVINSSCSVRIGAGCLVAQNVLILDYDGHPIYYPNSPHLENSNGGAKSPVEIGDNVWIGRHCVILKGIKIGNGSIIATGSVVTKDIPSSCIAAGNPARIIREGVTWKF